MVKLGWMGQKGQEGKLVHKVWLVSQVKLAFPVNRDSEDHKGHKVLAETLVLLVRLVLPEQTVPMVKPVSLDFLVRMASQGLQDTMDLMGHKARREQRVNLVWKALRA